MTQRSGTADDAGRGVDVNLARAQQEVVAALDAGDLQAALDALQRGIDTTQGPGRERLRLIRAQLLLSLGQHTSVHEALTDEPFDDAMLAAEAALLQAEVHLAEGQLSQALAVVDAVLAELMRASDAAAVDLADVGQRAHLLGAAVARHMQDPARALQHLHQLGTPFPHLAAQVQYEQSLALRDSGQPKQALILLHALLDDPELGAMAQAQLAPTFAMLGDTTSALTAAAGLVEQLPPGPERAQARFNHAVLLRELGDLPASIEQLTSALAEPEADATLIGESLVLLGISERERGDASAALGALRQVADAPPNDDVHGRARLEIGATLAETGLFGIAGEELTAAVALCADPDDRARALRLRAMARQEMQLLDMALVDLAAAAELTRDPLQRAQGEMQRAAILLRRERRGEALQVAREAIPIGYVPDAHEDEEASRLYVQRGALRSELGDLEGASEDLRRAATLAQMRDDHTLQAAVLADLGAIEVARGDLAAAREALEAAARLEPSGPAAVSALSTLGQVFFAQGDPLAALETWERAAGAAQDDRDARARAFLLRANAELRLEELVQAEADFQRVLTLQASRALIESATIALGGVQSQLESLRSARDVLTTALRGGSGEGTTYRLQLLLRRGQLALTSGDHEAALADFTRAVAIDGLQGERAEALGWLALALARVAQRDEALVTLREAFGAGRQDDADWVQALRGNWRWGVLRHHAEFPAALRASTPAD